MKTPGPTRGRAVRRMIDCQCDLLSKRDDFIERHIPWGSRSGQALAIMWPRNEVQVDGFPWNQVLNWADVQNRRTRRHGIFSSLNHCRRAIYTLLMPISRSGATFRQRRTQRRPQERTSCLAVSQLSGPHGGIFDCPDSMMASPTVKEIISIWRIQFCGPC
jgi:hypothetical protein